MTPTPIPGDTPGAKHTDTLVARLREPFDIEDTWGAFKEAADRIQQLEAENADLRAKLEKAEGALEEIAQPAPDYSEPGRWRSELARAALTDQANIRSPVQSEMSKMVDPRKDEN